jgi:murein DD-endopeptidase MepM/ murein hydrolase activator NlpD
MRARTSFLLGLAIGVGVILVGWCGRSWPHADSIPAVAAPAPSRAPAAQSPRAVSDLERLRARKLALPVAGFAVEKLHDSFREPRGGRRHQAIDLPARRGTRVLAVDDGTIVELRRSRLGGLTIYQFDPDGAFCYSYAHLDAYAPGLREGRPVRKGDTIGFVGTTGNAPRHAPHLHFAVARLGPEKSWGRGAPIDPYPIWAPGD